MSSRAAALAMYAGWTPCCSWPAAPAGGSGDLVVGRPPEEAPDNAGGGVEPAFEEEVTPVEEVDLRIGGVVGECTGAVGAEDLVVAAPDSQHRHPAVAQVGVQPQNACGHDTTIGVPDVPRPIFTDPEIAASASPKHRPGTGMAMMSRQARSRGSRTRAVIQNETAGSRRATNASTCADARSSH
jgi:hypothetical protein